MWKAKEIDHSSDEQDDHNQHGGLVAHLKLTNELLQRLLLGVEEHSPNPARALKQPPQTSPTQSKGHPLHTANPVISISRKQWSSNYHRPGTSPDSNLPCKDSSRHKHIMLMDSPACLTSQHQGLLSTTCIKAIFFPRRRNSSNKNPVGDTVSRRQPLYIAFHERTHKERTT